MGLDGVEFLMDIEDAFGVSINDEEAEQSKTIGDITNLVFSKMEVDGRAPCDSRRRFREVQRSVESWFGRPMRFRPSDPVGSVLPLDQLRPIWAHMTASGITPPRLAISDPIIYACILIPAAAGFAAILMLRSTLPSITVFVGGAVFLLLLILAFGVARLFAIGLPAGVETMGDLVRRARVEREFKPDARLDSPGINEKIRDIASKQFGVPIEKISSDTRFGDDLDV